MKYVLGLCELYNMSVHGKDERSNKHIETHYIIRDTMDYHEYFNNVYKPLLNYLHALYLSLNQSHQICNSSIRNFDYIIQQKYYITPHIFEIIELETGEHVACIKTSFIKIIQRRWKNIYKQMLKQRNFHFIKTREITGK